MWVDFYCLSNLFPVTPSASGALQPSQDRSHTDPQPVEPPARGSNRELSEGFLSLGQEPDTSAPRQVEVKEALSLIFLYSSEAQMLIGCGGGPFPRGRRDGRRWEVNRVPSDTIVCLQ